MLYGHPQLGDERALLRFDAVGRVDIARASEYAYRPWTFLSEWTARRGTLHFSDALSGRRFEAELDRATLGGVWRTAAQIGGWWCAAMADQPEVPAVERPLPSARAAMPPLSAVVMAAPVYPIQAIREARQGRAVACYLVSGDGEIFAAELLELSDEIFRTPTLEALARSRYRPWSTPEQQRPVCRTYLYRLDALR
jgi:hypothetical protein